MIDDDKRRQYDNEHSSTSRGNGYDKNPFDEFNDDIFKDKSRTYHDTFTSGSTRKKKGDNIIREVNVDFVAAIKGANVGNSHIIKKSLLIGSPLVLPVGEINVNLAQHPLDVSLVVDLAQPFTAEVV